LQGKHSAQSDDEVADDDPSLIKKIIETSLADSSVLILTGGVSVGDHDYTKDVLEDLGVKEIFWKVAQKPGKPLYVGVKDDKIIFGLPGNPYAVFTSFHLYIKPTLCKMMGHPSPKILWEKKSLSEPIKNKGSRSNFLKGYIPHGASSVEPLQGQGSHMLHALVLANCLIKIPAEIDELAAGEPVEVVKL